VEFRRYILFIDALINLTLGALLLFYSENLASLLGVPIIDHYFYPNILGGVFIGIAIAIFIAFRKKKNQTSTGLGLMGALAINLCGGLVLLMWLIFGDLGIPMKGKIFLWSLDIVLIVLSCIELIYHNKTIK
jgi:hypothetical protein